MEESCIHRNVYIEQSATHVHREGIYTAEGTNLWRAVLSIQYT